MPQRGHVLVIEEEACQATQSLWERVRDEGYVLSFAPLAASAQAVARYGRPDAVILNLLAAEMAGERGRYLDAAARLAMGLGPRRLPVIAVGETGDGERSLGVADVVAAPLSARRLTARLVSLTRLATMQAEVRRRIETAAEFGAAAAEPTIAGDGDANVLVVGTGRRYGLVEAALSRNAVIVGAFTARTATDYLGRRPFDVVVVDLGADPAAEFLADLRSDPSLFALPAVAILDDRDLARFDDLFAAGATEVILASGVEGGLNRVVRAAVAEQRLREALRGVQIRSRDQIVADGLTGLASRGFLMSHLGRSVVEAQVTSEALSVASVEIFDLEETNRAHGYAAGDHLIRQVGMTLGRLVRGEDLAARYEAGRFLVLFPGTTAGEAEAALRRILAVLRATRFALPGADGFVTADVDGRVVASGENDTAESVIALAFRRG